MTWIEDRPSAPEHNDIPLWAKILAIPRALHIAVKVTQELERISNDLFRKR